MKELNVKDLERAAGGFGPGGCTDIWNLLKWVNT